MAMFAIFRIEKSMHTNYLHQQVPCLSMKQVLSIVPIIWFRSMDHLLASAVLGQISLPNKIIYVKNVLHLALLSWKYVFVVCM